MGQVWYLSVSIPVLCILPYLFLNRFSCVFVTFPCGILGQVWHLIVSIPDFCLLPYFVLNWFYNMQRNREVL